ncbi:hypothetical protein J5069_22285 [Candidatus Symbiopectobacterium sp. NZEC127]|uniref:hypothetical protein n=1 Tax=Candidatus Symbiopectobacterium sp. NZEC127 TaxID=2820472 RepID=UPI002227B40D|nr:hypothetical protein [Candidatus Symbiopectobacterium sp. NZEC127]MCW2488636.1 hypothetical protein [Candidatus Symbiopectobacterium sp. NZEC127]
MIYIQLKKYFIDGVLLFFLIFGFYLTEGINSSFLVPFISILIGLLFRGKEFVSSIRILFLDKNFLLIISCLFFISLLCVLITVMHEKYDFSYFKNFISQVIQIICIFFFICLISANSNFPNKQSYFEMLLIFVFVAQSLIQISAFLFPVVANFVHFFYLEDDISNLYEKSGMIRGLALASSSGWGLAVGYACVFILFTKRFLIEKKISLFVVLIGVLLFVGCFFSGRTAFVGALLSFFYYCFSSKRLTLKIKEVLIFIIPLGILLFLSLMFFGSDSSAINKVLGFAFEPIYNYINSGRLETHSTNTLMDMWDKDVTIEDFMYGVGVFTDPNTGKYYMQTDVGYLRNLYYGGILWVLIISVYHLLISGFFLNKKHTENIKPVINIFILLSFILEFKAMTLGFNKYLFTILVSYQFVLILNSKKKYE